MVQIHDWCKTVFWWCQVYVPLNTLCICIKCARWYACGQILVWHGRIRCHPGGNYWYDSPGVLSFSQVTATWRSGTRRFHLRVPDHQTSRDFITWEGAKIVAPEMAARRYASVAYNYFDHEKLLHHQLTHCGREDLWKWTIFNTILTSPKSWLSQEDLDAGCEHSLVPMDS